MTENEFLEKVSIYKGKIGQWKIEVGTEIYADYSMGCLYDSNEKAWKVYVNNERGRHRIRLVTNKESDAFNELFSLVKYEVENNKV